MRFPLILAAASLALSAALPSCTPAARREAAAVVSTVAPALCSTLVSVAGADGQLVGLVCADVAKGLAAGLMLAQAGGPASSVATVAARDRTCTPVLLTSADPGRDPREYVCAEAAGGEGAARLVILNALATGHAR